MGKVIEDLRYRLRLLRKSPVFTLGAQPLRLMQQLLAEGMLLGLASAALGIVLAPPIASLLIRVCGVIAAVAFASAALPARRAAKVDPLVALRYE